MRTPNILLNSNLDCKIGDFGISDNLGYTQLNHQGTYYHKLLPPECNTGGKFEKEGDVYVRKKKKSVKYLCFFL